MTQQNPRRTQNPNTADFLSLSRMIMSETTDYEYTISVSGYQMKHLLWGLYYLQLKETEIPQLDFPKSTWRKMRQDIIRQVDGAGKRIEPKHASTNHLDVMAAINEIDDQLE